MRQLYQRLVRSPRATILALRLRTRLCPICGLRIAHSWVVQSAVEVLEPLDRRGLDLLSKSESTQNPGEQNS